MSRFSILVLAVAFCISTQEANAQSKTTAQPKIIDQKTWTWKPSTFNYAKLNDLVFEVGMGNHPNGGGAAYAGIEIENASTVKVNVETPLPFIYMDDNSLAGFMVDYHTAGGYTKRVALTMGLFSKKRGVPGPIEWGKAKPPDQFVNLGKKKEYHLDLKNWAPVGWDGKVWFSISLQNSGRNTTLKAKVGLLNDKIQVAQKPKEEPGKVQNMSKVIGYFKPLSDGPRHRDDHTRLEFTKEGRAYDILPGIREKIDLGTWTFQEGQIAFKLPNGSVILRFEGNDDTLVGTMTKGNIKTQCRFEREVLAQKVVGKYNRLDSEGISTLEFTETYKVIHNGKDTYWWFVNDGKVLIKPIEFGEVVCQMDLKDHDTLVGVERRTDGRDGPKWELVRVGTKAAVALPERAKAEALAREDKAKQYAKEKAEVIEQAKKDKDYLPPYKFLESAPTLDGVKVFLGQPTESEMEKGGRAFLYIWNRGKSGYVAIYFVNNVRGGIFAYGTNRLNIDQWKRFVRGEGPAPD